MSVSTLLTPSTTGFSSLDAQSLFRQLGTQLSGDNLPSPGVAVASVGFVGTTGTNSAPGISNNSVVVITGYNALPNPATTWSVSIDVPGQSFTITSTGGDGQAFNWIVVG